MDRRSAAALAYTCAAIYVVVTAVIQFGQATQNLANEIASTGKLTSSDLWAVGLPFALIIGLLAVIAVVLITQAHRLASRLFPAQEPTPQAPPSDLTISALHQLAFNIIGLIVLCLAVPELIYLGADAWRSRDFLNDWLWHEAAPLAGVLVQILVGYVLFFFPGFMLRLWSKLGGRFSG